MTTGGRAEAGAARAPVDRSNRRPVGYWEPFNTWWRSELEARCARPQQEAIASWYRAHMSSVWPDSANAPSLKELRTHAKCLRSTEQVRNYFRRYRAERRQARRPRGGARPAADGPAEADDEDSDQSGDEDGGDGGGEDATCAPPPLAGSRYAGYAPAVHPAQVAGPNGAGMQQLHSVSAAPSQAQQRGSGQAASLVLSCGRAPDGMAEATMASSPRAAASTAGVMRLPPQPSAPRPPKALGKTPYAKYTVLLSGPGGASQPNNNNNTSSSGAPPAPPGAQAPSASSMGTPAQAVPSHHHNQQHPHPYLQRSGSASASLQGQPMKHPAPELRELPPAKKRTSLSGLPAEYQATPAPGPAQHRWSTGTDSIVLPAVRHPYPATDAEAELGHHHHHHDSWFPAAATHQAGPVEGGQPPMAGRYGRLPPGRMYSTPPPALAATPYGQPMPYSMEVDNALQHHTFTDGGYEAAPASAWGGGRQQQQQQQPFFGQAPFRPQQQQHHQQHAQPAAAHSYLQVGPSGGRQQQQQVPVKREQHVAAAQPDDDVAMDAIIGMHADWIAEAGGADTPQQAAGGLAAAGAPFAEPRRAMRAPNSWQPQPPASGAALPHGHGMRSAAAAYTGHSHAYEGPPPSAGHYPPIHAGAAAAPVSSSLASSEPQPPPEYHRQAYMTAPPPPPQQQQQALRPYRAGVPRYFSAGASRAPPEYPMPPAFARQPAGVQQQQQRGDGGGAAIVEASSAQVCPMPRAPPTGLAADASDGQSPEHLMPGRYMWQSTFMGEDGDGVSANTRNNNNNNNNNNAEPSCGSYGRHQGCSLSAAGSVRGCCASTGSGGYAEGGGESVAAAAVADAASEGRPSAASPNGGRWPAGSHMLHRPGHFLQINTACQGGQGHGPTSSNGASQGTGAGFGAPAAAPARRQLADAWGPVQYASADEVNDPTMLDDIIMGMEQGGADMTAIVRVAPPYQQGGWQHKLPLECGAAEPHGGQAGTVRL